jgi:hypothetical protein
MKPWANAFICRLQTISDVTHQKHWTVEAISYALSVADTEVEAELPRRRQQRHALKKYGYPDSGLPEGGAA